MKALPLPVLLGAVTLLSTSACVEMGAPAVEQPERAAPVVESAPLPPGTYDLQSISYDDASGAYRVFLVGAPSGVAPLYQSTQLKLARLSDEDIAGGKKSALRVDADGTAAVLTPDFQIAFTHNVVEERQGQTVVVRQESSTWSPFMSAMTGMMIGNMLFAPRYYYPPPYVGGGRLAGFGGSGATQAAAAGEYTQKHGAPPKSAVLSKSGYSKMPSSSLKSTGSGAGANRLNSTKPAPARRSPFGGGGRGFGRRR